VDGYRELSQLYKLLSHPVRLRILEILAGQEACVCHLTAALRKRQPYVSQQLAVLREAGLVTERREGTLIYYSLRDPRVAEMIALGKAGAETSGTFPALPDEKLPNCPCPRCQGSEKTP